MASTSSSQQPAAQVTHLTNLLDLSYSVSGTTSAALTAASALQSEVKGTSNILAQTLAQDLAQVMGTPSRLAAAPLDLLSRSELSPLRSHPIQALTNSPLSTSPLDASPLRTQLMSTPQKSSPPMTKTPSGVSPSKIEAPVVQLLYPTESQSDNTSRSGSGRGVDVLSRLPAGVLVPSHLAHVFTSTSIGENVRAEAGAASSLRGVASSTVSFSAAAAPTLDVWSVSHTLPSASSLSQTNESGAAAAHGHPAAGIQEAAGGQGAGEIRPAYSRDPTSAVDQPQSLTRVARDQYNAGKTHEPATGSTALVTSPLSMKGSSAQHNAPVLAAQQDRDVGKNPVHDAGETIYSSHAGQRPVGTHAHMPWQIQETVGPPQPSRNLAEKGLDVAGHSHAVADKQPATQAASWAESKVFPSANRGMHPYSAFTPTSSGQNLGNTYKHVNYMDAPASASRKDVSDDVFLRGRVQVPQTHFAHARNEASGHVAVDKYGQTSSTRAHNADSHNDFLAEGSRSSKSVLEQYAHESESKTSSNENVFIKPENKTHLSALIPMQRDLSSASGSIHTSSSNENVFTRARSDDSPSLGASWRNDANPVGSYPHEGNQGGFTRARSVDEHVGRPYNQYTSIDETIARMQNVFARVDKNVARVHSEFVNVHKELAQWHNAMERGEQNVPAQTERMEGGVPLSSSAAQTEEKPTVHEGTGTGVLISRNIKHSNSDSSSSNQQDNSQDNNIFDKDIGHNKVQYRSPMNAFIPIQQLSMQPSLQPSMQQASDASQIIARQNPFADRGARDEVDPGKGHYPEAEVRRSSFGRDSRRPSDDAVGKEEQSHTPLVAVVSAWLHGIFVKLTEY
jgi:hypothetical protein